MCVLLWLRISCSGCPGLASVSEEVEVTNYPKILRAKKTIQKDVDEVLKDLKPICFFDRCFPNLYRDRRELRIALNKFISTLEIGNGRRY